MGGTTTAVLMGFLLLSLTPERAHGPTVAGSVPIRDTDGPAAAGGHNDGGHNDGGDPPALGRAVDDASGAATGVDPAVQAHDLSDAGDPPLATVLTEDGTAVAPSSAVLAGMATPDRSGLVAASSGGIILERISRDRSATGPVIPEVEVTLTDGSRTMARVIDPGDGAGLALIQLAPPVDPSRPRPDPYHPSPETPLADSVVTVLTDEPVPIRLVELLDSLPDEITGDAGELPYPDGTPVVDGDGLLIGVLACGDDGMVLVPISPTDDDATTIPATPAP